MYVQLYVTWVSPSVAFATMGNCMKKGESQEDRDAREAQEKAENAAERQRIKTLKEKRARERYEANKELNAGGEDLEKTRDAKRKQDYLDKQAALRSKEEKDTKAAAARKPKKESVSPDGESDAEVDDVKSVTTADAEDVQVEVDDVQEPEGALVQGETPPAEAPEPVVDAEPIVEAVVEPVEAHADAVEADVEEPDFS